MFARIQRPVHQRLHLQIVEGLAQEIVGAQTHGAQGGVPFREGSHDDHENVRIFDADLLEQLKAVDRFHAQIGQHQGDLGISSKFDQRLGAIGSKDRLIAVAA